MIWGHEHSLRGNQQTSTFCSAVVVTSHLQDVKELRVLGIVYNAHSIKEKSSDRAHEKRGVSKGLIRRRRKKKDEAEKH